MITLLSDTASADPLISGNWIVSMVVAVLAGVGGWKAKEKSKKLKIEDPVPDFPVRKVFTPPSFHQHQALAERVERLEERITAQERIQSERFLKLMEAGETRKDAIMEKFSHDINSVYVRINQLSDVIRNRKP